MRHMRGDSLEKIGREFKVAKYSSVSSVIERKKAMIAKNQRLKTHIERLKKEINMSQEQTWPLYNQLMRQYEEYINKGPKN